MIKHRKSLTPFVSTLNFCASLLRLSYLGLSQAIQVGDVEHAAHSGGVHATCASLLQTQVVQDLTEAGILGGCGTCISITILLNVHKAFKDLFPPPGEHDR